MRLDVHAHVIPEDCLQMTYRDTSGRVYGVHAVLRHDGQWQVQIDGGDWPPVANAPDRPFDDWFLHIFDMERRIHTLSRMGIDKQAVAIPPFLYFYAADAEQGLAYARKLNDSIARLVDEYPDHFIAMATVPLQDGELAARELDRAVRDLGMKGVMIGSNVNGRNLDEPGFRPFFAKAEELGVPIFIHPHYVLAQERLQRYHLVNLIGNPTDTAVAAASLVFGGVMEEFPRLKVYLAHAGGVVPYIRGRWEHGWRNNPNARRAIDRPPSHYLARFYYDSIAHSGEALSYLVRLVGADKVMLGTDYPFDMGDYQPVQHVESLSDVPAEGRQQIIEENAPRLFGLIG